MESFFLTKKVNYFADADDDDDEDDDDDDSDEADDEDDDSDDGTFFKSTKLFP